MPKEWFSLLPEQASTFAWQVDALYILLTGLSVFFTVAIIAVIIFFSIKYRRRSAADRPAPIHGNITLELAWSIIPMFMAIGVFALGADLFFNMYRTPADGIDIYVVGKQWMWKIQHPEGKREINTLHVPVNQTIRLTLTSEDVIHSFYIPAFRTKKDAVPGRYNTMWFEATKVGQYHLFCAEYCGTQHAGMVGTVYVMEPEDYQRWLTSTSAGGEATGQNMAQLGEQQFQQLGCQTCHKSEPGGRGPILAEVFGKPVELASGEQVTVDETYVRESILTPAAKVVKGYQSIMPAFQGQVSEETLTQLVEYVKSLSAAKK